MAWRALAFSASGTLSSMSGTSTSTTHRGEGESSQVQCKWPRPEGTRKGHVAFLLEHFQEHVLSSGHKQPTTKRWGGGGMSLGHPPPLNKDCTKKNAPPCPVALVANSLRVPTHS
jgi:hypothetical protein